jgi:hypothetical protein
MSVTERIIIDKFGGLFAGFTDVRKGKNCHYAMRDIVMGGFAPFHMQDPSFLHFQKKIQKHKGRSNCQTLYGMTDIPGDSHIRTILDAVDPAEAEPGFNLVLNEFEKGGGLKDFQRLGGHVLVALDGTQFFSSTSIRCSCCLTRKHKNTPLEYYHSMVSAALVAPGHTKVIPLMPEFIRNEDGQEKQDCERNATKRWFSRHGARLRSLKPIYLGDALLGCQPICETVLAYGGHYIFTSKPEAHKTLYDFIEGCAFARHTVVVTSGKRKITRHAYHYRWIEGVPLRDGKDAMLTNWLELEIQDEQGKTTFRRALITDLPLSSTQTVIDIMAAGRARWKIENETFNVLKNHGYNLEHNFGHGKKYLAMTLVTLNLLAFAVHTLSETLDVLWRNARSPAATRRTLFEYLRSLVVFQVFDSWTAFLTFIGPVPDG